MITPDGWVTWATRLPHAPMFTSEYSPYGLLARAKHARDGLSLKPLAYGRLNLKTRLSRHFDPAVALANSLRVAVLATLRDHVFHVLFPGSKEQVVRANASRIVAMVADIEPIRDGSKMEFPRSTVRVKDLASMTTSPNLPISNAVLARHAVADPFPAIRILPNLLPESVFKRARAGATFHTNEDTMRWQ